MDLKSRTTSNSFTIESGFSAFGLKNPKNDDFV